MDDWYRPDELWKIFPSIKSRKDFMRNWVIWGNFHSGVPKDILNSFETAEYIMAHAWYHWPMYDAALVKVLGILEMAVKYNWITFNGQITVFAGIMKVAHINRHSAMGHMVRVVLT